MCVEINKPINDVDTLTVGTINYKVLFVDELKPGNVNFFYTVYLGK